MDSRLTQDQKRDRKALTSSKEPIFEWEKKGDKPITEEWDLKKKRKNRNDYDHDHDKCIEQQRITLPPPMISIPLSNIEEDVPCQRKAKIDWDRMLFLQPVEKRLPMMLRELKLQLEAKRVAALKPNDTISSP